jgi:hypothetical protein
MVMAGFAVLITLVSLLCVAELLHFWMHPGRARRLHVTTPVSAHRHEAANRTPIKGDKGFDMPSRGHPRRR